MLNGREFVKKSYTYAPGSTGNPSSSLTLILSSVCLLTWAVERLKDWNAILLGVEMPVSLTLEAV